MVWAVPWQRWWQTWPERPNQLITRHSGKPRVPVHATGMQSCQGHTSAAGKMCPQKAPVAFWSGGDQKSFSLLKPKGEHFGKTMLTRGERSKGLLQPCHPPLSCCFECPHCVFCWYPNKRRKSQFMLSSTSLSPHLCQSPDKRSHYFKTPADVCLSFVMNSWAAVIVVALLIGAPTVLASERLLFVSHKCFFFQQVWFTDMSAHIWIQVAPESPARLLWEISQHKVFRKPTLLLLPGLREEVRVDKVSH